MDRTFSNKSADPKVIHVQAADPDAVKRQLEDGARRVFSLGFVIGAAVGVSVMFTTPRIRRLVLQRVKSSK
jgi:hypothetical protein